MTWDGRARCYPLSPSRALPRPLSRSRFVLILEHLDALCPADGGGNGSAAALEVQVVATVCRRIDQLGLPSARHSGFIVATSSRPDAIHPAVRYGAHLDPLHATRLWPCPRF